MKDFVKWFGIIAVVAVIGFAFAACDIPKDELDGTTWKGSDSTGTGTVTFDSPNFTYNVTDKSGKTVLTYKGTYSISGNTVTFTINYPEGLSGQTITGTLSGNKLTSPSWSAELIKQK
jgi:hypothetical protein